MNQLEKQNIDIFAFNNNEVKPFNLTYYSKYTNNASLADIANLANVKKRNIFLNDNYFTNLRFNISINDIAIDIFDLIRYLPDIINDIQHINYTNETTYIDGDTIINNAIVKDHINVNKVIVRDIHTNTVKASTIKTKNLQTNELILNTIPFQDSIGFIYINNFSLPLDQNIYLFSDFNLTIIGKVFITLKPSYNVKIYDVDNILLFCLQNETSKIIFMNDIFYNNKYFKIEIKLKNK